MEKILGATARLDEAFVILFLRIKRGNGYSDDQIYRKGMSLEGVLVPVTPRWIAQCPYVTGIIIRRVSSSCPSP